MGMYDTYQVRLRCPIDNEEHVEWQGKDGPCLLYTWQPARKHPLEAYQEITEADHTMVKLPNSEVEFPSLRPSWLEGAREHILPPIFRFSDIHGDHFIEAVGETDAADVWDKSRILEVWMSIPTGETTPYTRGDGRVVQITETRRLRLWRAGAGLDEANMALRAEHHQRMQAQLATHGGAANCERCRLFRSKQVPAVAYADMFLCESCASERIATSFPVAQVLR